MEPLEQKDTVMSVFKSCDHNPLHNDYTLWSDTLGVTFFKCSDIYVMFRNKESGAVSENYKIIGLKLDRDGFDWLCNDVGYAGNIHEFKAINDVIHDMIYRVSPKAHLEKKLGIETKKAGRRRDEGFQP